MASLKGRHFSFSDRLYFRKIFQLAGKGHTNVSAVWRKGDPTMQTEISLKGQYKNTVFSFISSSGLGGQGCGGGQSWGDPSSLGSALSLPCWTSLFSETANCIHPLSVCLSTWVENRQICTLPGRGARRQRAHNLVFLLLPTDSGEQSRVGFILDGWFGDF